MIVNDFLVNSMVFRPVFAYCKTCVAICYTTKAILMYRSLVPRELPPEHLGTRTTRNGRRFIRLYTLQQASRSWPAEQRLSGEPCQPQLGLRWELLKWLWERPHLQRVLLRKRLSKATHSRPCPAQGLFKEDCLHSRAVLLISDLFKLSTILIPARQCVRHHEPVRH